jgi:hypothetical protein
MAVAHTALPLFGQFGGSARKLSDRAELDSVLLSAAMR